MSPDDAAAARRGAVARAADPTSASSDTPARTTVSSVLPASPTPSALASQVAQLRAQITALVSHEPDVDGATGPALHAELRTAAGQLQAFAARVLARVEADGRWSAGGARTFPNWVARRQLASTGSVRREVTLGRALDDTLPHTSAAVARGEVTVEHAEVLARVAASSEARRTALASEAPDRNEAALVARARHLPLDAYRREVDRWAAQVDAAAAESEHEAACAKEYLTLARRRDGVALQGFLTFENAEVVATALRSVAGVPSHGDTRSREERQAAALVDAGRLILDRGFSGGGQQVRPHLLVHVPVATLQRLESEVDSTGAGADASAGAAEGARANAGAGAAAGTGTSTGAGAAAGAGADLGSRFDGQPPATLHDGTPLPPSTLDRLVYDGELTRIVFSADGAVLDVGRAHRTYSGQQRLAVIARDESCRYPGCGAPPTLGEVHHVTSWASGGRTSVSNGVLLCWFHHALVHRRGVRISRSSTGWEFHRDDGTAIDDGHSNPSGTERDSGGPSPGREEQASGVATGPPPSTWGGPDRPSPGAAPPRPSAQGRGGSPNGRAAREASLRTPQREADAVQDELALPA